MNLNHWQDKNDLFNVFQRLADIIIMHHSLSIQGATPTCFCFCLACENRKNKCNQWQNKGRGQRGAKLFFVPAGIQERLEYSPSPADGGVVLQLPVTISPKLEEFPPAFLQKPHRITGSSRLSCVNQTWVELVSSWPLLLLLLEPHGLQSQRTGDEGDVRPFFH